MTHKLFQTTVAGSLPKPAWLAEPEKLWAPWRLEGEALDAAKRDAALVWLKEQEAAGIDVVSNGEQFRVHFVHGFLEHVGAERIFPCTNCGMAPLSKALATLKLQALGGGADLMRNELGGR